MSRYRIFVCAAATLSAVLWAYACGDGTTEPPAPDPLLPTTVTVSPAPATVVEGATLQLTATATNAHGQVVTGAEFVWASGDTAVAVVDASGLVTGVAAGQVQVTATATEVTGRATLTVVAPVPTTIAVIPDTVVLTVVGQTAQLTAEVRDQAGGVMDGVQVAWSSGDTAVAVVDSAGLVAAVDGGAATVMAQAGEASGDALVTVAINPDRAALVALYNATDGPNWADNTNWLTDAPLGEWYGVDTDAAGRVVRIDLAGQWDRERGKSIPHGLWGTIPPELGSLANLEELHLRLNELSGAIPPELGNLANLEELHLSWNELSGAIPPELGDLSNLQQLHLQVNDLSGAIPPELGNLANLEYLVLFENKLSGAIPPTLLNLSLSWFFWQPTGQRDSGLCAPGTSIFVEWLDRMDQWRGPYCNASDEAVLASLYELAGGGEWTESLGWLDGPALEEWHGVETDSLGRVTALDLSDNGLSGGLPGAIGNLGHLTQLLIEGNELGGRLPLALTALDLDTFHYDGTDLCEPADAEFRTWLDGIPSRRGTGVQCAPLTDRDALVALYEANGGPGWTNSDGWLTEAPLRRWHGVEVDSLGRVTRLNLRYNGLTGAVPPELGDLSNLQGLHLDNSELTGAIPPELGNLANLEELHLYGNELSGAIPPELSNLANLEELHLYGNNLTGAIPPALGNLANLEELHLYGNNLSGAVPPALGDLVNLRSLDLDWNELTGSIPPELGNLSGVGSLDLARNQLTGAIPPELGHLSNLWSLNLSWNKLTGSIPPELGNLSGVGSLDLDWNELTGAIPPELGNLTNLRRLDLAKNALAGTIPPELGNLANLNSLHLSWNELTGAIPPELRNLDLELFLASGTDLCVPQELAFEEWLAAIPERRIARCGEPSAAAYLVQAVQSRAHPVPLVAGEDALLRVFVTAARETDEGIPDVRARFYLNGSERHVANIAGSTARIPTEIDEGDLSKSANAEIPGRIVRPGLEMVVEIDPGGVLDPGLGVPKRIPQEGRLVIDVRDIPVLDLTVIPFLWSSDPDSAIVRLVDGMAADPESHALLEDTHVLLPVADINVTAHAPVASTSNNVFDLLTQTKAIRVLEGGGYYAGMMSGAVTGPGGAASGRSNFSRPEGTILAHELGHNMRLGHAPCGGAPGPDPFFPDLAGAIGAWGYDFRRDRLVPTTRKDYMSYCDPDWTSDYHFTKALRFRLYDEGPAAAAVSASTQSLLLWGGVGADIVPYLEPAFVIDAPAALPDSAGEYRITGRTAGGGELFSLSFTMPETADGDGRSSFAFALPVRLGWDDNLATITLDGPGGNVTLDGDSDVPMAILRDPRTGQVRGILRDPPLATEVAADAVGVTASGLEVLFSRGIPGTAAWRR